jgi:hypothetical protein
MDGRVPSSALELEGGGEARGGRGSSGVGEHRERERLARGSSISSIKKTERDGT